MEELMTKIDRKFSDEIRVCVSADLELSYAENLADRFKRIADETFYTQYSFINELFIINYTDNNYNKVRIKVNFSNPALTMVDIERANIQAKSELAIEAIPDLVIDQNFAMNLTETLPCFVEFVLINDETGEVLHKTTHSFSILPYSQPSTAIFMDSRLYAKYVTPLSPSVKKLMANAAKKVKKGSFIAYQNKNVDAMLEELRVIYNAIHEWGINYQNPPAGSVYTLDDDGEIKGVSQRIRMAEEVLSDKKGTCLDLSMLFCACLEEVGYHSILTITDSHAICGVFLKEDSSINYGVERNIFTLSNKISDANKEILLFETTTISASSSTSFQEAIDSANAYIKGYIGPVKVIDIFKCRSIKHIYDALPVEGDGVNIEVLIEPKKIDETELDKIEQKTFVSVLKEAEKDRFTFWEKKLLDLTESNPLVNMRLKSSSCLKATTKTNLWELLENKAQLKLEAFDIKSEYVDQALYALDSKWLRDSDFDDFDPDKVAAIGLEKTLKELIKKSNSAMDETGAPTLYLCLGRIEYIRKKSRSLGNAPFMVLPIKITKDKAGSNYTMSYDFDDLMLNQTFFEYYSLDEPDLNFEALYGVKASDGYLNIVDTLRQNWGNLFKLYEADFFIANLTFSHYIMWLDVRKRKEELKKNKVIESILNNKNCLEEIADDDKPIDASEIYQDFAAPLPYDSTQLKAILDCGKGKSFILDGPPGTGKSQTIVNMIVNAFYHGKTVLFVAEKKAALDVVADRLSKIQLGRFCLELHSNKANKADFFSKLRDSMELGVTKAPEDFEKKCQEIDEKRKVVLESLNKMHENKYLMNLYDSIVTHEYLEMLKYVVDFDADFLTKLKKEDKEKIDTLLEKYMASIDEIEDYDSSPLKLLDTVNINFADKDKIIADFDNVLKEYNDLLNSVDELFKLFGFNVVKKLESVKATLDLYDLTINKPIFNNTLFEFMNFGNDKLTNEIFDASSKYLNVKKETDGRYNYDKLTEIDADSLINDINTTTGFFKKGKVKKNCLKQFKANNPDYKFKKKLIPTYLNEIKTMNDSYKFIKEKGQYLNKLMNLDYLKEIDKFDELKTRYTNSREIINKLNILAKYTNLMDASKYYFNVAINKANAKMTYSMVNSKLEAFKNVERNLGNKYYINYKLVEEYDDDINMFKSLLEYGASEEYFNDLIDVANLNRLGEQLSEFGLDKLLNALRTAKFDYADLKDTFDLSLAEGYIKLYFKDEKINYFIPSDYEAEIKKYKGLINEYNNLVIEQVSAKLTKNLSHGAINYAQSSPIGKLKKSISSNGRGVTIRDTLIDYDEIIRSYFPCFLMSPLSAAQYLAVDADKEVSKFDLVIFDEASQIPTHEAIGPIARGKSLIVAGDPEQMPPSAYFSAGLELEGEDVQYEDAVSLLDECIAIELPRHRLAYHYRSKHESLIEFSNQNFYNGNLYTFPSPNTRNSMIDFKYVELKENKKDSGITKEETDAILEEFKKIYENPATQNKSVGIIVFNIKQAEKVEDAITVMLSKDKKLRETVDAASEKSKEPWFVKSLENVQGDERDIILISIGFRCSATGSPVINGPIARENGQRRLNVAVSRSKEQMIVISTIRYSDFSSETKSKSKGPKLLKEFLRFAEQSSFARADKDKAAERSIVYYIQKDLEERGYDVAINVGNSVYKVDLAIKSEDKKSYELGVLIDQKGISTDISCRDKFYVQQSVLNGLKWRIISIYAIEYHKNPKATIDKIIAALGMDYVKEETKIEVNIEKEEIDVSYKCVEYKKAKNLGRITYDNELGFSKGLPNLIQKVIDAESPVSTDTIRAKVKEYSDLTTMGAKVKARLDDALKQFNKFSVDQNQKFYWSKDASMTITEFRINSGLDIYDIAKEEIICAMKQVSELQGEISKEDLFKLTLQALKAKTVTLNAKAMERMNYVYDFAKKMNLL